MPVMDALDCAKLLIDLSHLLTSFGRTCVLFLKRRLLCRMARGQPPQKFRLRIVQYFWRCNRSVLLSLKTDYRLFRASHFHNLPAIRTFAVHSPHFVLMSGRAPSTFTHLQARLRGFSTFGAVIVRSLQRRCLWRPARLPSRQPRRLSDQRPSG